MHLDLIFSNPQKSNTKVEICDIWTKLCQNYTKHYTNSTNSRLPRFHDLCPQIIVRANSSRLNNCVIQYAQSFPNLFICKNWIRAKNWKFVVCETKPRKKLLNFKINFTCSCLSVSPQFRMLKLHFWDRYNENFWNALQSALSYRPSYLRFKEKSKTISKLLLSIDKKWPWINCFVNCT